MLRDSLLAPTLVCASMAAAVAADVPKNITDEVRTEFLKKWQTVYAAERVTVDPAHAAVANALLGRDWRLSCTAFSYPVERMEMWAVSDRVNHVSADDAGLLEPVSEPPKPTWKQPTLFDVA